MSALNSVPDIPEDTHDAQSEMVLGVCTVWLAEWFTFCASKHYIIIQINVFSLSCSEKLEVVYQGMLLVTKWTELGKKKF